MTHQPPIDAARRRRLGVVTPLANERDTIDEFVRRVLANLLPADRLYLVLDRVSRDGTLPRARELAAADSRIAVVFEPSNRCVVDAYFAGYRAALSDGCEWILEMDGGLSHDPGQIPRFLAAMALGVDFAGGSRFMPGGRFEGRLSRRALSQGGSWLANTLLHTRMFDMTSGFECFTRAALEHVVRRGVRSRAHFFQTEIRLMMHAFEWIEVPITYSCPSHSVGQSSVLESFSILFSLYQSRRRSRWRA